MNGDVVHWAMLRLFTIHCTVPVFFYCYLVTECISITEFIHYFAKLYSHILFFTMFVFISVWMSLIGSILYFTGDYPPYRSAGQLDVFTVI